MSAPQEAAGDGCPSGHADCAQVAGRGQEEGTGGGKARRRASSPRAPLREEGPMNTLRQLARCSRGAVAVLRGSQAQEAWAPAKAAWAFQQQRASHTINVVRS